MSDQKNQLSDRGHDNCFFWINGSRIAFFFISEKEGYKEVFLEFKKNHFDNKRAIIVQMYRGVKGRNERL